MTQEECSSSNRKQYKALIYKSYSAKCDINKIISYFSLIICDEGKMYTYKKLPRDEDMTNLFVFKNGNHSGLHNDSNVHCESLVEIDDVSLAKTTVDKYLEEKAFKIIDVRVVMNGVHHSVTCCAKQIQM